MEYKSYLMMDEETLSRLAAEALIVEAEIGARRAEIMGPSGWLKPKQTINKRFLHSTLHNMVISNRYRQKRKEKNIGNFSRKDLENHPKNESM